jgi:hypothetical protein
VKGFDAMIQEIQAEPGRYVVGIECGPAADGQGGAAGFPGENGRYGNGQAGRQSQNHSLLLGSWVVFYLRFSSYTYSSCPKRRKKKDTIKAFASHPMLD